MFTYKRQYIYCILHDIDTIWVLQESQRKSQSENVQHYKHGEAYNLVLYDVCLDLNIIKRLTTLQLQRRYSQCSFAPDGFGQWAVGLPPCTKIISKWDRRLQFQLIFTPKSKEEAKRNVEEIQTTHKTIFTHIYYYWSWLFSGFSLFFFKLLRPLGHGSPI